MTTAASASNTVSGKRKPAEKGPARKSRQKQPPSIPERLKRLFTSLCAQIDGGHFHNAIKTCDKVLGLDSRDADALQTKLFLLLQTEQYNPALELIDSQEDAAKYAFEKAYTLYRLQRESEASQKLEEFKVQKGTDRGIIHLEAQMASDRYQDYRQGDYQAAVDLYNQLLDTAEPNSEEQSDILTNLQASQQHLDFINAGFLQSLDSLPSYISAEIESAPPPQITFSTLPATLPSAIIGSHADDQQPKPAAKKTRKSRIPPGVIPGVTPPPDPERWLKKSERSTFQQAKRRKGAGGGGATQGAANPDNSTQITSTGAISHTPKSGGSKGKKRR
ncbi:hypothetical protein M378DRAFT_81199 [Amanita muscaria Koide BX008]|uniref:Signal recognition particle subunit SRP72 n=1 Tax=Amanita muscaria (strain Koide BX008) TaxID=946122 RepID=A0A0C2WLL2_AMAMK|nr:hypothetical protein M378DRAFT_81199 [Amanita muscaria Koide BX008]